MEQKYLLTYHRPDKIKTFEWFGSEDELRDFIEEYVEERDIIEIFEIRHAEDIKYYFVEDGD